MRFAITLLAALVGAATFGGSAMAGPLDAVRWRQRVLVIFGNGMGAVQQSGLVLVDRAALSERSLLVLSVGKETRVLAGEEPSTLPTAANLRTHYRVSAEAPFVAVLIGLDGGEKWRATKPTPADQIFAVIDAMPMRRAGLR